MIGRILCYFWIHRYGNQVKIIKRDWGRFAVRTCLRCHKENWREDAIPFFGDLP